MPLHVLLEVIAPAALELASHHPALMRSIARVARLVPLQVFLALKRAATPGVPALVLLLVLRVDQDGIPGLGRGGDGSAAPRGGGGGRLGDAAAGGDGGRTADGCGRGVLEVGVAEPAMIVIAGVGV